MGVLYKMDGRKIFITQEGLEELKKERLDLVNKKRPHVLERLSEARAMGDLSENSEYTAAREELALIDGRIEELEDILKSAEVINDSNSGGPGTVRLGSKVKVEVRGKHDIFALVGEWEADPKEKKISHESPLGKALIGKNVGDKVEVEAPAGTVVYTVVSVD